MCNVVKKWNYSMWRTRPSPPVTAKAPSANTLLPLPCPLSRHAGTCGRDISRLPHLVHLLHSYLRTQFCQRIILLISLCAVGARLPALCYTRAHLRRKGRRLQKKSRPPDNNVFKLLVLDRQWDLAPLPSPPQSSSPNQGPINLPPSEASNSSRSSILSCLGSVKRWGIGRRSTSTGPSDAPEGKRDATPRAAASRDHHPAFGFFGLRRARLIRHQAAQH